MEKVSQPAWAVIATNIIVTVMITHSLSLHRAQTLVDIYETSKTERRAGYLTEQKSTKSLVDTETNKQKCSLCIP